MNHTGQQAAKDPLRIVSGAVGCDDHPKLKGDQEGSDVYADHMVDFMYTAETSQDF